MEELVEHSFKNGSTHFFLEMSGGNVNPYRNGCISDQSEVDYRERESAMHRK